MEGPWAADYLKRPPQRPPAMLSPKPALFQHCLIDLHTFTTPYRPKAAQVKLSARDYKVSFIWMLLTASQFLPIVLPSSTLLVTFPYIMSDGVIQETPSIYFFPTPRCPVIQDWDINGAEETPKIGCQSIPGIT